VSKTAITVFLCTGKDCGKAWRRLCAESPGKWLKHHVKAAGLPYKLEVVKTECMDHCEEAACLCLVHGRCASLETNVHGEHDADRLLAAIRSCIETAHAADGATKGPSHPVLDLPG
jgi:hypothetical protein